MSDAPPRSSFDAIYLSPHADDAAFSCGGQIHARAARGERVLVVTVFAGPAPPAERLSPFAASLHRHWRLEGKDAAAARRAEDERAVADLGATVRALDFLDAIYRSGGDGEPLYPSLASLFRERREEDRAVAGSLDAALRELPPSPFVAAPLAVGAHVDHRLVQEAARRVVAADALWLYEDYPYAESWRVLRRATARCRGWDTRAEALAEEDLLAKCRAIGRYQSQLGATLTAEHLERRIRRFTQRRGGERLWHPPRATPSRGLD